MFEIQSIVVKNSIIDKSTVDSVVGQHSFKGIFN